MRKYTLIAVIWAASCLWGCGGEVPSLDATALANKVADSGIIGGAKVESLLDGDWAERYGMSKQSVAEGSVCYDVRDEVADKVVIVRAKDEDALEKVERALTSERARLIDALEHDGKQREKADRIVTKTYGLTTALIICDDPESVEKLFDKARDEEKAKDKARKSSVY